MKIAGIQVESLNGQPEHNLRNAEKQVRIAVSRGASLIVGPELLATGYLWDRSIWKAAEPRGGLTEKWLRRLARQYRIWMGAGYLEADGNDFFNTFALMNPDGRLAGRVRKQVPGFFESWIFKSESGPRTVLTDFGKVGIGICFDCYTGDFLREMWRQDVDLVLMPHSAAQPERFKRISHVMVQTINRLSPYISQSLSVPVLLVNKSCSAPFTISLPLFRGLQIAMTFEGGSVICNAKGKILDRAGERQGVVIADLRLNSDEKMGRLPVHERPFWSLPPVRGARLIQSAHQLVTWLGRISYQRWISRNSVVSQKRLLDDP